MTDNKIEPGYYWAHVKGSPHLKDIIKVDGEYVQPIEYGYCDIDGWEIQEKIPSVEAIRKSRALLRNHWRVKPIRSYPKRYGGSSE